MGSCNRHLKQKCICGHERSGHTSKPSENGGWTFGPCRRTNFLPLRSKEVKKIFRMYKESKQCPCTKFETIDEINYEKLTLYKRKTM